MSDGASREPTIQSANDDLVGTKVFMLRPRAAERVAAGERRSAAASSGSSNDRR